MLHLAKKFSTSHEMLCFITMFTGDLSTSKSERNVYGEEMVSTQPKAHLGMANSFRLSTTACSLGLYRTYRRSLHKTKT